MNALSRAIFKAYPPEQRTPPPRILTPCPNCESVERFTIYGHDVECHVCGHEWNLDQ